MHHQPVCPRRPPLGRQSGRQPAAREGHCLLPGKLQVPPPPVRPAVCVGRRCLPGRWSRNKQRPPGEAWPAISAEPQRVGDDGRQPSVGLRSAPLPLAAGEEMGAHGLLQGHCRRRSLGRADAVNPAEQRRRADGGGHHQQQQRNRPRQGRPTRANQPARSLCALRPALPHEDGPGCERYEGRPARRHPGPHPNASHQPDAPGKSGQIRPADLHPT
mmetsp:Transcript_1212/g.3527  ORF Transcript_1212/g.3527 Transcript_1212/m.3527 type:complete len:216 (+) Transcript_1212:631-1278(+)